MQHKPNDMALVDATFVQRPCAFHNDESRWQDERFQLLSFVDVADPQCKKVQ